jgi:hypothetical protein
MEFELLGKPVRPIKDLIRELPEEKQKDIQRTVNALILGGFVVGFAVAGFIMVAYLNLWLVG